MRPEDALADKRRLLRMLDALRAMEANARYAIEHGEPLTSNEIQSLAHTAVDLSMALAVRKARIES